MIGRSFRQWLWQGTLDPPCDRMEIWSQVGDETGSVQERLGEEVQRLVQQVERTREAYEKRLAAEMTGRQSATASSERSPGGDEIRELAKGLLPSLDALDRIIEFGEGFPAKDEAFENWLTSVKALQTRLRKTLEGIGLVAISSVGMQVDLELHDVIAVAPSRDYLPNTVVAERQKGYYFRGKLLRDAKVIVAQ